MAGTFRFLATNLLHSPDASLSASSFVETLPPSFLLDQLKSKPWRSASGWTIIAGYNDTIDFTEAAPLVATLTPGTYATGSALAAEMAAALEAAGANTYSGTYSVGPFFTLTKTGGPNGFTIQWSSGPNNLQSVGPDAGYAVTDDTGGGPYSSDLPVYQSKHYVTLTLAAEDLARFGAIIAHNVSDTGTVLFQGTETADFSLVDYTDLLDVVAGEEEDIRLGENSDWDTDLATNVYWRVTITDRANQDGFAEIGAWLLGQPVQTSIRPSINYSRNRDELSQITHAIDGAHHGDLRPSRHVHGLEWDSIEEADLAILEGVQEDNPPGRCFLVLFDSEDESDAAYGFWADGLAIRLNGPVYWNVNGTFLEALG